MKTLIFFVIIVLSVITLNGQEYYRLPMNTTDGSNFHLMTGFAESKLLGAGGNTPTTFHEGIDIKWSEGNFVFACRSGTIFRVAEDGKGQGFVAIKAPIVENPDPSNENHYEYDIYLHIDPRNDLYNGQPVNVNEQNQYFKLGVTDDRNHIHFVRLSTWSDELSGYPGHQTGATNSLNPISIMPIKEEYNARDWPCSGDNKHKPPYLSGNVYQKVSFYENLNEDKNVNSLALYGNIDIVVAAKDDLFNNGYLSSFTRLLMKTCLLFRFQK